ncbi:MAG TPA: DUF1648 domain-containing protein [Candidatus Tumulicola sp.]
MVNIAMALCAAAIAGTIAYTALRYRELPDRVPLHFGIAGWADGYGPRATIWLLVVVQLFIMLVYRSVSQTAGPRLLYADLLTIVLLGWIQMQIIAVAIAGTKRIPPARLYTAVALFFAGVLLSIFVVR